MLDSNFWLNSQMSAGNFAFLNTFAFLFIPFMVWSFVWKGWALWRAAKNDSKPWFIALLLVNTLGVLEILYLFVFGKKSKGKK